VFLLVPEAASAKHLELLSTIAEMLSDDGFRERLLHAEDATAMHRMVCDWAPLQHAA
jgi:PTS system nitrogen regulatory IIA component